MNRPAIPPTKRRRLQESATSLSKPFRSPVRPSIQEKAEKIPTDESILQSVQVCKNPAKSRSSETIWQSPVPSLEQRTRLSVGAESLALQSKNSSLLKQLAKLRHNLDTVQQAEKIESLGKDAELEKLIQKWKHASRELAEQVFCTAKDRVNRTGGISAWRDKHQPFSSWDEKEDLALEDLTDEQREAIDDAKAEAEHEKDYYRSKSPSQEDNKERDQSFTMDMMLKSLNIDVHLLGYDEENQRWID